MPRPENALLCSPDGWMGKFTSLSWIPHSLRPLGISHSTEGALRELGLSRSSVFTVPLKPRDKLPLNSRTVGKGNLPFEKSKGSHLTQLVTIVSHNKLSSVKNESERLSRKFGYFN